ncbi:hypothetical protein Tco_1071382 [Tanacetum coccineum]
MGLWYPKDFGFELTVFSDADHARCLDTRKSTSRGIQFLALGLWLQLQQNTVVLRLSVSHSNLMQPRAALPYQAHPYSILLYQRTALPEDRFQYLVRRIGMRCLTPAELESLRNHRYKLWCCSLILAESDSLPHAHAQTTKTYYKHQDSRIKKAQEIKTKTSAISDIKDPSSETKLQGILLESFQEDAKYEHFGQDTRSQGGKDD